MISLRDKPACVTKFQPSKIKTTIKTQQATKSIETNRCIVIQTLQQLSDIFLHYDRCCRMFLDFVFGSPSKYET